MAGFKYRNMRPDIARDLRALIENCIRASELQLGEINENHAKARLVGLLEDEYPEHRMAVMNRDVLAEICKEAITYHINNVNDPVNLAQSLGDDVPPEVREVIDSEHRIRRYFRIKNEHRGCYEIKRREHLTRDDWEQVREQRHQKEREVGRKGDYADAMIQLADALQLEGAIGEQVYELAGAEE
jgi:hypothetical protein